MGIFQGYGRCAAAAFLLFGLFGSVSVAETFVAPSSGTLYVKCVGGSAGAVSQFGTGTSISDFKPLLDSLPQSCPTTEVAVGHVTAGQVVPYGIHTVWQGTHYFAFSTDSGQSSTVAFSDVNNTLGMGGKIIQQTGTNTWVMHLNDAAHYTIASTLADNILIQLRLDDSQTTATTNMKPGTIDGPWSASFTDSKASGTLRMTLYQDLDGVTGKYTSSLGGEGKIEGTVVGEEFAFELMQTAGCPGTYNGKGTFDGDRFTGTYTGSDCLGERANGRVTMTKGPVRVSYAPAPTTSSTPLPPLENGPLTVTAVANRIIPHYRTTHYVLPGHSNTSCFGQGTYLGGGVSTATADCSTTTTPPQDIYRTGGYVEVFNQVESNGVVFTLRCTARWYGSNCAPLTPGDRFPAEIKGKDMWITAHKGGNLGKEAHAKYEMLDRRPGG